MSRGFLMNWCQELMLSNEQRIVAFTHAKDCTKNVFKQVFQFKINTYILPTNEYLKKYKVVNSDLCSRCLEERDTIVHKLWDCECTNLFLQFLLNEEKVWTGRDESLNMVEYLFGTDGFECVGTNHGFTSLRSNQQFHN